MALTTDELKALLAAATPGHWHTTLADETLVASINGSDLSFAEVAQVRGDYDREHERMAADAALIARARGLAAEVIRLREQLERQQAVIAAVRARAALNTEPQP